MIHQKFGKRFLIQVKIFQHHLKKAEEFVKAFASASNDKSLPARRKAERQNIESTAEYRDPACDNTQLKKNL